MPHLSLYLTQEQFLQIENKANAEKKSLSEWAMSKIFDKVETSYPDGWADLFGSITDSTFSRPEQPSIVKRENRC